MTLQEQIDDARNQVAETAIASPYIYHEYGMWQGAKHDLAEAQSRLEVASARWRKIIDPALKDDLLRALAERKGLIP